MSRASPFFRSPFYSDPYHPSDSAAYFSPPLPAAKPKVFSIPVHFVGSGDDHNNNNNNNKVKPTGPSPAAASTRIQSAFRGFLVRKNVKLVRAIGAEVDEIEMRFRRDEKERLKINEMLMRLLFRLDSVRGVRDYRKRVIQRVIRIQEMLDSITTASAGDQTLHEAESLDNAGDRMVQDSKPDNVEGTAEETAELEEESEPAVVIEVSKSLENAETPGDDMTTENHESVKDAEEGSADVTESIVDYRKGETVKYVMERMVAENEKLKGVVAELCERSVQQCQLMCRLAERVEHLEKIVERSNKKNKKKRKDNSLQASAVEKKCGRITASSCSS